MLKQKLLQWGALFGALLTLSNPSLADSNRQLEQLASEVAPLWLDYRPACVMALEPATQLAVSPRLTWLDTRMEGTSLKSSLAKVGAPVLTSVWNKAGWRRMSQLEADALSTNQREDLREYHFKLQVNKANAQRSALIERLAVTATQLNLALREGIWKTCHALGMSGMAQEQLEATLESRWLKQSINVSQHLSHELMAFYFFSYRQIANEELEQFAQLHADVQPWTEAMAAGVLQHFAQLRSELVQQGFAAIPTQNPSSAPFPSNRPWTQAPSQFPSQP